MKTVKTEEIERLFSDFAAQNGVRHVAVSTWRNLVTKAFLGKNYFLAAQCQKDGNKKTAKTCRMAAKIDKLGLPIVDGHFISHLFPGDMLPPKLPQRFSFQTIGQLADKLPYEWEAGTKSSAFRKFIGHIILMAKYDRVYR